MLVKVSARPAIDARLSYLRIQFQGVECGSLCCRPCQSAATATATARPHADAARRLAPGHKCHRQRIVICVGRGRVSSVEGNE